MSIVDKYSCTTVIVYLLKSSWYSHELTYNSNYHLYLYLLRHEYSDSTEDIGHVEVTRERRGEVELIGRYPHIKLCSKCSMCDVLSSNLCTRREANGIHIINDNILGEESLGILTIDIDYSDFPHSLMDAVLIEILEESYLGINIVIHRSVEIEVILSDIGENSNIIVESQYSMIEECMTRGLDNSMRTASGLGITEKFPENKW